MPSPTYCKVFEAVGDFNAIGRGTLLDCHIMLEAGYRVSVVAKLIDPDLKNEVEWLPLQVPERGFALQWLTARRFLLEAMGEDRFDAIHGHQPQISDSCDVFQCHFLTRAAARRGVLAPWKGKRALTRIQEEVVLRAEDRFYRRLAQMKHRANGLPAPHVLFISGLLQNEFHHLYGKPSHDEVLVKAPPPTHFPSEAERQKARQKWVPDAGNRLVVGFLGGTNPRKGCRQVVEAMARENELYLLFGGPNSENFHYPALEGRLKSVGFVDDTPSFYAACDVFLVASHFEPLGMVALEAAAHGVPVLATSGVGALQTLLKYGAGAAWERSRPLGEAARDAASKRSEFNAGALRLCEESGARAYGERLVEICQASAEMKARSKSQLQNR